MLRTNFSGKLARLCVVLGLTLAVAACAGNTNRVDPNAGAATPGSLQDFAVNVGDRVFFTVDSTQLTPTARATLDKQASWLALYPQYTVTIEGHADERGTREYNIGLSARRADSVKNYLVSRGVPPSRFRTLAFGKERPVAACDAENCWSQNRRSVTALQGAGS